MILNEPQQTVPLKTDKYGVIRVGKTRVTLDSVAATFDQGATPEDIVNCFPSLNLADVYAVIAFMIRHEREVKAYLADQDRKAEEVRREVERLFPQKGLREKLLARRRELSDSES